MSTGTPLLNAPRFTPKRDKMIDTRSVACPVCKAYPRAECTVLKTGAPMGKSHPARRRMAVRADNAARGI